MADLAGHDVVSGAGRHRYGFTGQRRSVDLGAAVQHLTVEGNLLARFDDDGVAHLNAFRGHGAQPFQGLHLSLVGLGGQQGLDGATGMGHGPVLQQFAHLEEDHDAHGLGIGLDGDGAPRGDNHQNVFIEEDAPADGPPGARQDIAARHQIGRKHHQQLPRQMSGLGNTVAENQNPDEQHGRRGQEKTFLL